MKGTLQKLKSRLHGAQESSAPDKQHARSVPGGRLSPADRRVKTHRVYCGVDFGTCSTKAVVQIDPEFPRLRRFFAISHQLAQTHGSSLLYASLVDANGELLWFGPDPKHRTKQAVRSFKMCLPCLWPIHTSAHVCPRCDGHGRFRLGSRSWTAEEISILFLANVIRSVKASVNAHLDGEKAKFFVNSAAPLDQMTQDTELGRSFQRVLFYADLLSDRALNPWPQAEAAAALEDIRREAVPPLCECPTTVFPETHAAMTSVLAGSVSNRNFGTLDIGAGTTDVAFYYYHRTDGEPEACYYQAESRFVGMDDVDRTLKDIVPSDANPRAYRETLSIDDLRAFADRFEMPIEQMWQHFRTLFGQSYLRNPHAKHWQDVSVHLIGGGAQFPQVLQRFQRPFSFMVGERSVSIEVPDIPDSVQMLDLNGKISPIEPSDSSRLLLLLAYGLSHGAATISNWIKDYSFYKQHKTVERGVADLAYEDF